MVACVLSHHVTGTLSTTDKKVRFKVEKLIAVIIIIISRLNKIEAE